MTRRPRRLVSLRSIGLVLALCRTAGAEDTSAEQFLIIPLRIHVLTSTEIDIANCKLTDADVARVVGNVNAIWQKAGIQFGVQSMLREPVAQSERFRITTQLRGGDAGDTQLWMLLPRASRTSDALHVYYFHELPYNSAYLGDDIDAGR